MIKINLVKLFAECNYERNLLPYMLKITLLEHGYPIDLDPLQVSDKRIQLKHGQLNFGYSDCENYLYVWKS
ncbi:hypothetical protein AVV44_gp200 [Cronobacter phage S13]|jgi:hypothetical protein|uniref:Uncharacterized protein n=1 Tax=Cronobacter phage LPCS28 TaxID=2924885 RepID=A0AAE9GAP6_9CAUD|nr:hypothetical protein AVV44_gp200 [Cronobacter phage S13]YP_010665821.1 hypothetical protein PQB73_gp203 [Cronobacter phage LPCS28]AIA65038.1 hypothetical protein S13_241 [Cronobacter phage S13]UNY47010.1 hypothetical protein EHEKIMEA_00128 [Cronobacter phage LPCS28]